MSQQGILVETEGHVETFSTDSGSAVSSAAGVITFVGDGGAITSSGAGSTVTYTVSGSVPTSFSSDSGSAVPAAGVITFAGGTGINTSGSGSTLTINLDDPVVVDDGGSGRSTATAYGVICGGTTSTSAQQSVASLGTAAQVLTSNGAGALPTFQDAGGGGGGLTWNVITAASDDLEASNGYFANNATSVTITLPATATVGESFEVVAMHAAGTFIVAQNAGQSIQVGNSVSTTGVGGSITSTAQGDWIQIVCNVTDTGFFANVKQGNVTVA